MGQASLDLPDLLDTPAPATLAETDDLLAQIAGDEIDRLLAQSEDGRGRLAATQPPAPTPDAALPAPAPPSHSSRRVVAVAPPVVAEPAAGVDEAHGDVRAAQPAWEDESDSLPPMLSPTAFEADAGLDKLLDEICRADRVGRLYAPPARFLPAAAPPPAGSRAIASAAPRIEGSAGTAEASAAGIDRSDLPTSAAERDALSLAKFGGETDAADEHDAAAAAARGASDRESVPVRLLELINAPLSFVPDGLRDALGKVAILTLVNSLALLIYILFIRR